jgi:hypothetical protein
MMARITHDYYASAAKQERAEARRLHRRRAQRLKQNFDSPGGPS